MSAMLRRGSVAQAVVPTSGRLHDHHPFRMDIAAKLRFALMSVNSPSPICTTQLMREGSQKRVDDPEIQ